MHKEYYSNGKLLLTGEYAVLDGALSLALPTRYGQSLIIKQVSSQYLKWTSYDEDDHVWFEELFNLKGLDSLEGRIHDKARSQISERLAGIIKAAQNLNPDFLKTHLGYEIETHMDFSRNWGLGSSSTLVNNIAQWAHVDAFELYQQTFGGSGYDIACAIYKHPILYRIKDQQPKIKEVTFDPVFKEHIYFVHLNKKQDSREGIAKYRQTDSNKQTLVAKISELTQAILDSSELNDFQRLLGEHEEILASALQMPTVQSSLFKDYKGVVKSLGAWGGDFVLAASSINGPEYFTSRGYNTIISYNDMILN